MLTHSWCIYEFMRAKHRFRQEWWRVNWFDIRVACGWRGRNVFTEDKRDDPPKTAAIQTRQPTIKMHQWSNSRTTKTKTTANKNNHHHRKNNDDNQNNINTRNSSLAYPQQKLLSGLAFRCVSTWYFFCVAIFIPSLFHPRTGGIVRSMSSRMIEL